MHPRIYALRQAGVSIWLDTLSRRLLDSGRFAALVREDGVTGATSNPTIFARALAEDDGYAPELRRHAAAGATGTRELFFAVALGDVRRAAALLAPVHTASGGRDGFVSFQTTPDLADNAAGMVEQALDLWRRLSRPNVLIKVPATAAGVGATEELVACGVNVNVTLLFSLERYDAIIEAYLRGLERRLSAGRPLAGIASVASFFVSRVDAKADAVLPPSSPARGEVAIANAELAYELQRARFAGERWEQLRAAGAEAQRLLWASTATKDPAYSDVRYVERLIAPGVINTMPERTLRAFADHGTVGPPMGDAERARRVLDAAAADGADLAALAQELEREGVAAFDASYEQLQERIVAVLAASERATVGP